MDHGLKARRLFEGWVIFRKGCSFDVNWRLFERSFNRVFTPNNKKSIIFFISSNRVKK